MTYFMTGPEGDTPHGWWRVTSVDEPKSIEFVDGFADQEGNPDDSMPTMTMHVQLSEHEGGTRMELRTLFNTKEQMEQLAEMGMEEGMRLAAGQMDALLAA